MKGKRKLTKRIAAWLMCLAMVLTTINLPAFTTEVKAEEAEEGSVTFWFCKCMDCSGRLGRRCVTCVYGNHDECEFKAYSGEDCFEYTRSWSELYVDYRITDTSIGGNAFGNADFGPHPKSIIIPNGITDIEDEAFQGCYLLESITIPDSVINIGDNVFDTCNLLTNVIAPCTLASSVDSWKGTNSAEVTYTHKYAVKDSDTHKCLVDGCAAEEAHSFTDGVCVCGYKESCSQGNHNFSENGTCVCGITQITYEIISDTDKTVRVTGPNTDLDMTGDLVIPSTVKEKGEDYLVTEISGWAFYENGFTGSLTIPDSVTTIGNSAFASNGFTGSLTLGSGIETIGASAFEGNGFAGSLTIPNSVTTIGKYAFLECGFTGSLTFGSGVETIGEYAFQNCGFTGSLTLGSGVETIGEYAFQNCGFTGSLTIPNSVTTIGEYAFRNCGFTGSLTLGSGVETIGDFAFYMNGFTGSLTIPDSVTTIGNSAFYMNRFTGSLIIPDSVKVVGERVFSFCNLDGISIPCSLDSSLINWGVDSSKITQRNHDFLDSEGNPDKNCTLCNTTNTQKCGEDAYYTFSEDGRTLYIYGSGPMKNYSFDDYPNNLAPWYSESDSLITKVVISDGITSIGDSAFSSCKALTDVTIPNGVTSIGDNAFNSCSKLTNITIPSSVTSIGNSAFSDCPLTNVTIPSSVTSIGDSAFSGCYKLTNVVIPSGVTSIGERVFESCGLTSITIPNSVTTIGNYAFLNCDNMTSVTIPSSVTSIGEGAFYYCLGLTSVSIPNSEILMGDNVFGECDNITNISIPCSMDPSSIVWGIDISKVTQGNHDFSESEYQNDGEGKHYRICALCTSESEHEACSGGTATCQKKAVCSLCKNEYGDLAAHTWDAGEITKAATCQEKGVKTFKCTVTGCTATKTEDVAIDSTNHVNKEVVGAKEATCKDLGYTGDTKCKGCGITLTAGTDIERLTTHTYVNGVCSVCDKIWESTVNGITYKTVTKEVEGKPVGQTVTVSGNDVPQVAVTVAKVDETVSGKVSVPSAVTGSGSDQTFVVTEISASAFAGTAATEVVVPDTVTKVEAAAFGDVATVTFNGNEAPEGVASAVSEGATINVPEEAADSFKAALGDDANIVEIHTHKYASTWTYDANGHWYATTCGHDSEEGVLDVLPHTFGEWTTVTEATEDAKGAKERVCACGYKETAEIEKLAHTTHIKDAGVTVDPTCETKGSTTYKCTKCGEEVEVVEIPAKGHSWDNGTVTKEPTETAEGVKTFKCKNCDKTKTEIIPKKEATKVEPKKGDEVKDDKKTGNYEIADTTKKEVEFKAPADKTEKTVTIPDKVEIDGVTYKVTKVDDGAFKGNKTVTTVKVPSTVTTIGKDAFKGCTALTKITLPSNTTNIGANAFNGCKKMKTITIKSTKLTSKSIASGAFKGLSKNVTIKVPKKQLKAYKSLLKKKGFKGKVK